MTFELKVIILRYLPQTKNEIQQMCETIGIKNPDDLFHVIPENLRLKKNLDLPAPLPEAKLLGHLKQLGNQNQNVETMDSFLGGGAYHHYIPTLVNTITSRGEFLTAYTPYQPEISQGTLQAVFEFQTMIASLTGMDLANASNYDGASALAEAALMAVRITGRNKILISAATHPQYRQVLQTNLKNRDIELIEIPFVPKTGRIDSAILEKLCDPQTAAVCIQSPNAFGVIEEVDRHAEKIHEQGALLVGSFSEAINLGILKPLGDQGADIVVGEGQSLGNALSLGGPYLGIFATKQKYVRQMPGRLVGETVDAEGKRGFVLVLATREQHIRREKATSNICTNQGLCALAAVVYLSLMGPQGLKKVAQMNLNHSNYLKEQLLKIKGIESKFTAPHFNEFVLQLPTSASEVLENLREQGILGGIEIKHWGEGLENCILICATEMNSKQQMDRYVEKMKVCL